MSNPIAVPGTNVPSGAAVSPGGAQGTQGINATNTTTTSFTVPAAGASANVTLNDASWVVTGQMVYLDQAAGGPGQGGILQVTNKSGNTLTLLNPQPPPAIPLASNLTSGLMNQLSGSVSDYVGGDNTCHAMPVGAITAFVTKTAAYTLLPADSSKYFICSGGSWTLTLPAPASGLNYRVRNDMGISGVTGTITIQPAAGTIDGLSSLALLPQQEIWLLTDSVNWRSHGSKREVILGINDLTATTASAVILLPVGYRYFELELEQIGVDTDSALIAFQLSADGGATWVSAANSYFEGIMYDGSATVASYAYNTTGTYGSLTSQQTTQAINSSGGRATMRLFPGAATTPATYNVRSGGYSQANARQRMYSIEGFVNGAGLKNALKYFATSGNMTRAFLTVKGVV
jgi:hypothetical protein